ncbi:kinase-like protein [Gymnopus androsaceus JB14]|uniref:Kinase-like protein n=1 Tax=Gymnopus androsaceus JB14 TaxID=1447944 RepID=A0A6A4H8V7_9AGAR|nr:kinase-like protein [Gymnopus androsaceus JB14]
MGLTMKGAHLHPELKNLYDKCQKRASMALAQPTDSELESTLKAIIRSSRGGCIIVDAIDECKERLPAIDWLAGLSTNLWVVITSQYPPEGRASGMGNLITLDNSCKGTIQDMDIHLDEIMGRDTLGPGVKDQMKAQLIDRSQGRFLWLDCQTRLLSQCATLRAVNHELQRLPKDLEETYTRDLLRVKGSEHEENVHNLLLWLTYAYEPLNLKQVADILTVDLVEQRVHRNNQIDQQFNLIRLVFNLVTIDKNLTVHLAHRTVKEFLINSSNLTHTLHLLSINEELGHDTIAQTCLIYLLYLKERGINHSVLDISSMESYTIKYWSKHAKFIEELGVETPLQNLTKIVIEEGSPHLLNWLQIYEGYVSWQPLYYAAHNGLVRTVEFLINKQDSSYDYDVALQAAARNNHMKIFRMLSALGSTQSPQQSSESHGSADAAAYPPLDTDITVKEFQHALLDYEHFKEQQSQGHTLSQEEPLQWLNSDTTSRIMDHLQLKLDSFKDTLDPSEQTFHRRYLSLLRYLSRKFQILPKSLEIKDIRQEGRFPVNGGGFADVYQGRTINQKLVCLKVLKIVMEPNEQLRNKIQKRFCHEALVWRQLKHPNILPLLGVNIELFSPSFVLISPWMNNQNITEFLSKPEHANHNIISVLCEIMSGLCYLHSREPPIVHGDIRGGNILVNDELKCCLADFGLSVVAAESEAWTISSSTANGIRGAVRWLAPEYLDPEESVQSQTSRDVYAFGCTIVEIISQKIPFHDSRNDYAIMNRVIMGRRPDRPESIWCTDRLWSLTGKCWAHNPDDRPSVDEIHAKLTHESEV